MQKNLKRILACVLAVVMVLCAVPVSGIVIAAGTVNIPSDAEEFNGHYYKVYEAVVNWDNAKSYCEGLGGHLVTITSSEENAFITSFNIPGDSYWIGAYSDDEYNYHWVTGESWRYENWAKGEPSNSGNQHWVCLYGKRVSSDASWDDRWNVAGGTGGAHDGFICEWDVPARVLTSLTASDGKDKITYSGKKQYSAKEIELECDIFNRIGSSTKKKYDASSLADYDCLFNKVTFKLPDTDILYFKKGLSGKDEELDCHFDIPVLLHVGESAAITTSKAQTPTTYQFVNGDFKLYVNTSYSWGADEIKKEVPIEVCVYNGNTLVSSCTKKITFINPVTEKAAESKEKAKQAAMEAARILNSTTCTFYNPFLEEIFTKDQLLAIQYALQCKIALCAVPINSYKSAGLSDRIIEKILNKAGVKREWLGSSHSVDVGLSVSAETKYGSLEILFSATVNYYSIGSDSPYGGTSFDLRYEVTGGKGKKRVQTANLSADNIGYIGFASFQNFSSAVKNVVMAELEVAFNLGYGNKFNRVCGYIFDDAFTEIISRTSLKSYSHMTWEAITFPAKQAAFRCPVDVYVYDAEGKQCAAVIDNEITQECEDIDIHINGDEKYFTIYEGTYSFECIATANGEMTITVDEYANKSDVIRSVGFDNIALEIGESYKTEVTEDLLDDEYQVVKSDDSVIMPDSDVVNLHQPQIVEIVDMPATCASEGQAHTECLVCGEVIDTYSIPVTSNHTDANNDNVCDECGTNIETEDPVKNCSCNCHKSGIMGFIWKIINFFNKLFKINPVCECGMKHY